MKDQTNPSDCDYRLIPLEAELGHGTWQLDGVSLHEVSEAMKPRSHLIESEIDKARSAWLGQ